MYNVLFLPLRDRSYNNLSFLYQIIKTSSDQMFKRFLNHRLSIKLCLLIPLLSLSYSSFSQTKKSAKYQENRFKYIEVKSPFGSFLKANSRLRENGQIGRATCR